MKRTGEIALSIIGSISGLIMIVVGIVFLYRKDNADYLNYLHANWTDSQVTASLEQMNQAGTLWVLPGVIAVVLGVITSYSIHYTKLYDHPIPRQPCILEYNITGLIDRIFLLPPAEFRLRWILVYSEYPCPGCLILSNEMPGSPIANRDLIPAADLNIPMGHQIISRPCTMLNQSIFLIDNTTGMHIALDADRTALHRSYNFV